MQSERDQANDVPSPHEIRAAVDRMTVSDTFSRSPQLGAFLRFVVEAVLSGKSDRIKAYTIGVEVLRRDVKFDPQMDPIVRVEGTRLRRTIERYYAGPGVDEPVIIDLPRGGYVPVFRRRETSIAAAEPEPPIASAEQPAPAGLPPGNGMPTLRVAPFVVFGSPDTRAVWAEALGGKLGEAFALFETINVTSGAVPAARPSAPIAVVPAVPGARSDYRLDGTVEYRGDQTIDIRFKLIDEADATVIWSRAFERLSCLEGRDAVEESILLELATTVVQPFGVVWSHERAKQFATQAGDPRCRALIEAGELFRSFDPAEHESARASLEHLTAADPGFASGFSYLATVYCREHQFGFGVWPGDPPALDRALIAARQGIELKPQGSRAHHVLFIVLFARGEIEEALAAAERAIALNRYDMIILTEYGGRMIFCGEVDKGMDILQRAGAHGIIRPSWHHFYLFLGHYLKGDRAGARYHAELLTADNYVFTHMARALIAAADGDKDAAQQAWQRIIALAPAWQDDARAELARFFPYPAIAMADRLARDLAAAGLTAGS